jgi:hypothetical protein
MLGVITSDSPLLVSMSTKNVVKTGSFRTLLQARLVVEFTGRCSAKRELGMLAKNLSVITGGSGH